MDAVSIDKRAERTTPRMRLCMRLCMVVAVFLPVAFTAGFVEAAEADGLEARKRAAKTACLSGDYGKGVGLLAEVYVDTNNPIYLFNQGRCFQQNGRYEDAVLRFREYQRKNSDAGGAHDPEAEKQIADCLSLLEIQKARDAEQRAAAGGNAPPAPLPPPLPPPGGGAPGPAAPPPDTSMPTQKKLGYISVGLGVAGGAASLIAYLMGRSYLDKAGKLGCTDTLCTGEAKDEYNRAQTAVTISNVTGISGGVLLVGGIVLILTSPSSAPGSHGVAVVPVVGPGLAQLALTGRF
jgi:tetratricopeptide (TPR) repeat protein